MKIKKDYDYINLIMFIINIILIILSLYLKRDLLEEYALFAEEARFFSKEFFYIIIIMVFFIPGVLGTIVSLANIKLKKQALRIISYVLSVVTLITIIGFNESFEIEMKGFIYILLIIQTIIMSILSLYNSTLKYKKVKDEKKRRNIIV